MLAAHIFFNGNCKDAIELYVKAFNATITTIMANPQNENLVIHSELLIHNQLLILNDFGDNDGVSRSGGYQLAVRFEREEELKRAYSILEHESTTISPMQKTDYSDCVVRFIDKFGTRWAFWL
jgi:PhnB protein